MKTRAKKKEDLEALTEQFKNSSSAMVLSFTKLSVEKDQQFRNELRETGAQYGVVKNTLARLAVKGTSFEDATEHFHGVTSVAWTEGEPVDLSKVISKYVKENQDIFEFKTGVVEGRVVTFDEVSTIASLPSKEELIGKLLYLLNAPAQRLATVLSAIPRDLASVVKQVSEREVDKQESAPAPEAAEEPKAAEKTEAVDAEEAKDAPKEEAKADAAGSDDASAESKEEPKDAPKEEAKADAAGSDDASAESKEEPKEESGADEASAKEESDSKDEGGEPSEDESK